MRARLALYAVLGLTLTLSWYLQAAAPEMTVYKESTCGCCNQWVERLRANGFSVTVREVPHTADYSRKNGVPDALHGCHSATVDGYTIEGHVPAADIRRLLQERPNAKGLAVPGMPRGAPGMEGSAKDPYSVLLFDAEGHTTVYAKYAGD